MNKVLLYYKYTKIEDVQALVDDQKALCKRLGLKGRILISDEGINGTIAGPEKEIDEYMVETNKVEGLEDMEWKISFTDKDIFPRLRVVPRIEVVTLGKKVDGEDVSMQNSAPYIEPDELQALYDSDEEFYIIDARNEYEARIGKFKDAITFEADNFRDIEPELEELEDLKDKNVVTYCTGGIRCEKFSALLKEKGFKNVRQLHGGIHRYYDLTGGKNFEGEMYVFDKRVHVPVNDVNPSVISECKHCEVKISRYVNCHNSKCNDRFICCEDCHLKLEGCCSQECLDFDGHKVPLKVEKSGHA